jgi:hypothetical protein
MILAGRRRLLALAGFALLLLSPLALLHPAARNAPSAAEATAPGNRSRVAPAVSQSRPTRVRLPSRTVVALDAADQSTAAQMACNGAVANVLARRLTSAEVRDTPRLAAGAVLIAEHLRMVKAVSTQPTLSRTDVSALERATRRFPDDALLARIYAARCQAPGCDESAAFAHLVALEPDNLASWMLAPYDWRHPSEAADDAWLTQAARTTYFDPGWSEVAFAVVDTAGPMPDLPVCDAPIRAIEPHLDRKPQPADAISLIAQSWTSPSIGQCGTPAPKMACCLDVMRTVRRSTDSWPAALS